MIFALIISAILIIASSIAKSVMDTLNFHYDTSIFARSKYRDFLDPAISWKRKYKNGDPKQGERFWGSSRWFSFVTDGWHLFQCVHLSAFFASLAIMVTSGMSEHKLIAGLAAFVASYLIYGFVFELFFGDLLED